MNRNIAVLLLILLFSILVVVAIDFAGAEESPELVTSSGVDEQAALESAPVRRSLQASSPADLDRREGAGENLQPCLVILAPDGTRLRTARLRVQVEGGRWLSLRDGDPIEMDLNEAASILVVGAGVLPDRPRLSSDEKRGLVIAQLPNGLRRAHPFTLGEGVGLPPEVRYEFRRPWHDQARFALPDDLDLLSTTMLVDWRRREFVVVNAPSEGSALLTVEAPCLITAPPCSRPWSARRSSSVDLRCDGPAEAIAFGIGLRIRARLVNGAGEPLPGHRCELRGKDALGGIAPEQMTAADGRLLFRLSCSEIREGLLELNGKEIHRFPETLTGNLDVGDIVIEDTRSVRLLVLDMQGKPIAGALAATDRRILGGGCSDAEGHLVVHGIPADASTIKVGARDYLPVTVEMLPAEDVEWTVRLEEAATLDFLVVGPDGEPLPHATVELTSSAPDLFCFDVENRFGSFGVQDDMTLESIKTTKDGGRIFRLYRDPKERSISATRLRAGITIEVTPLSGNTYGAPIGPPRMVETPERGRKLVRIQAERVIPARDVRGVVRDGEGRPVEGATVYFWERELHRAVGKRTNRFGEYHMPAIMIEGTAVNVSVGDFESERVPIVAEDDRPVIQLDFVIDR